MIENIKSLYYIRNLFDCISERKKLEIAKYNKSLQNKIKINILNYKVFSGRYIIYEENGKGKEYNAYTDELIYEGVYFHGKRNENYFDEELSVIKEMQNGKEYIKEYNKYHKLIFEGEYSNGEKNGKGKEYKRDNK